MLALFAVGAITGTVLSFEMGFLWLNFTGTFPSGFSPAYASRTVWLRSHSPQLHMRESAPRGCVHGRAARPLR